MKIGDQKETVFGCQKMRTGKYFDVEEAEGKGKSI
jgi:hypothetical protein